MCRRPASHRALHAGLHTVRTEPSAAAKTLSKRQPHRVVGHGGGEGGIPLGRGRGEWEVKAKGFVVSWSFSVGENSKKKKIITIIIITL